jgi:hypothetical protein
MEQVLRIIRARFPLRRNTGEESFALSVFPTILSGKASFLFTFYEGGWFRTWASGNPKRKTQRKFIFNLVYTFFFILGGIINNKQKTTRQIKLYFLVDLGSEMPYGLKYTRNLICA